MMYSTYEGFLDTVSIRLADYLLPAALIGAAFGIKHVGQKQFHIITRLSQVKITRTDPSSTTESARTFIRLSHGGHVYHMGMFPRYRDIELEDIKIWSMPNEVGKSFLPPSFL